MSYFCSLSAEEERTAADLARRMTNAILPVASLRFRASVEIEAAVLTIMALTESPTPNDQIEGLSKALLYIGIVSLYRQLAGEEPATMAFRDG